MPTSAPVLLAPSDALAKHLAATVPPVQVDRVPFTDVVDSLRDIGQANVHVDWRSLAKVGLAPATPVTANEAAMPLGKMIDAVVERASNGKATSLASGDIVWITSKDAAPALAARLRAWSRKTIDDPVAKAALDKPVPEIKAKHIPTSDVVDFLRDVTGANMFVDWRGLQAAGVKRTTPVTLRAHDVTLSDALLLIIETIQEDAPLEVTAESGVIAIAPAERKGA